MKTRDLVAIGIPAGPCADRAKQILQVAHSARRSMKAVQDDLKRLAASPATFVDDDVYGSLAQQLLDHATAAGTPHQHNVMDRDWSVTPVTSKLKDRAWAQLGHRAAIPAGARCDAAICGARRSAHGLQGHRRSDGRTERPGRNARPFRPSSGEDGTERRAAGRLMRQCRKQIRVSFRAFEEQL